MTIKYFLLTLFCGILFIGTIGHAQIQSNSWQSNSWQSNSWHPISPGLDYMKITNHHEIPGYIHIFRINLQKNTLNLALAEDDIFPASTVPWMAEKYHALVAVNGGFFTPIWKPLGLRIQNGHLRNPLKTTAWWPVFYIKNNQPFIISEKMFSATLIKDSNITFAIQSGPQLVSNNKIPSLKLGLDERTAIGITKNNEIILLATENWPLATFDLARFLQQHLDCTQAMNLDGGSSTQLSVNTPKMQLQAGSFAPIADIVYVMEPKP